MIGIADIMPDRLINYNQGGGQVIFLVEEIQEEEQLKYKYRAVEVPDFSRESITAAIIAEKYGDDDLIDSSSDEYNRWLDLASAVCDGFYFKSELSKYMYPTGKELREDHF